MSAALAIMSNANVSDINVNRAENLAYVNFPMNSTLSDFDGNIAKIAEKYTEVSKLLVSQNQQNQTDLKIVLITPELSLCGYPPQDLLLHTNFAKNASKAIETLKEALLQVWNEWKIDAHIFVGCVEIVDFDFSPYNNIANIALELYVHARTVEIVRKYTKRDLPNYSVFDEKRVFVSGLDLHKCGKNTDFATKNALRNAKVAICEDIWNETCLCDLSVCDKTNLSSNAKKVESCKNNTLIVMNASPYRKGIKKLREDAISRVKQKYNFAEVIYVNAYGGHDELVFDGSGFNHPYEALVLGLRDYIEKNFGSDGNVVLGISGGIDSALTATIAVDALGSKRVHGILMPSKYSSSHSIEDGKQLCDNLSISYEIQNIEKIVAIYQEQLKCEGIALQNIQARIRGNILMNYANSAKKPTIALATSNKSELAVGYSTVYGDAVGGYAPLKDVLKTEVWEAAKWRNALNSDNFVDFTNFAKTPNLTPILQPIPQNSISKPPSAELAFDQKDEDTLPPYEILDKIINYLMNDNNSAFKTSLAKIDSDCDVADSETINRVQKMMQNAEWKRRQFPPGPKISKVSFGRDWRMPITGFKY